MVWAADGARHAAPDARGRMGSTIEPETYRRVLGASCAILVGVYHLARPGNARELAPGYLTASHLAYNLMLG